MPLILYSHPKASLSLTYNIPTPTDHPLLPLLSPHWHIPTLNAIDFPPLRPFTNIERNIGSKTVLVQVWTMARVFEFLAEVDLGAECLTQA